MQNRFDLVAALTFAAVAALTGCSDKKEASKSNFKAAIQEYYDKGFRPCVSISVKDVPFTLEKKGIYFQREPQKATALVKAGLLSEKESEVRNNWNGKMEPATEYSLTDEGKKYRAKEPGVMFCGGEFKVVEVENFTEPADMLGTKVSQVNFTYKVVNAPAWAKNPDVQAAYPAIKDGIADKARYKTVLVATSEGWMHERLFKNSGLN